MWETITKDEYVSYFEVKKDKINTGAIDRIVRVVGKDVVGAQKSAYGLGSKPIYHPIVQDMNGHMYHFDGPMIGALQQHSEKVYAIKYSTLKNLIIPRMQNNHYYKFLGYCVFNNSKRHPGLNCKDMVYTFEDVLTKEVVYMSDFMAFNREFPTLIEFFGHNTIMYLLEMYGNGKELLSATHLFRFEDIA